MAETAYPEYTVPDRFKWSGPSIEGKIKGRTKTINADVNVR